MQIFVTGGTGLVGSVTIRSLLAHSPAYSVRALARSPAAVEAISALGATPVEGDLMDVDLLAIEGAAADAVVYCAFGHSADRSLEATNEARAIAVLSEALSTSGSKDSPKILMYCSGLMPFPPSPAIATEESPTPTSLRGESVTAVEQWATAPPKGVGIRGVQIRLAMIVHQEDRIHGFLHALHQQTHFGYYQDGTNQWPAIHAPDVGELVVKVLDQQDKVPKAKAIAVHAFAERVSTQDIAVSLANNAGLKAEPFGDDVLKGLDPRVQRILAVNPGVVNDWTRSTFGWEPKGPTLLEDIRIGRYFQK